MLFNIRAGPRGAKEMKAKDLPEVVAFLIVFAVGMVVHGGRLAPTGLYCDVGRKLRGGPTWFTAWFYRARTGTDVC